jgi:hypothetical protein
MFRTLIFVQLICRYALNNKNGGELGFTRKVANLPKRSQTVTIEVYLIFELAVFVKTHISFSGMYGPKTHREDASNVGQYLLITRSCLGGFFYSHNEHPRVDILTE